MKIVLLIALTVVALVRVASAGTLFIETENFQSKGGWIITTGPEAKRASGVSILSGARGEASGTATTTVKIKDAGRYYVWVRYASHPKWHGPFRLTAIAENRELGSGLFDTTFEATNARDSEVWKSFDVVLPTRRSNNRSLA